MASSNGGIIGVTNAPTSTTATGIWSLSAAMLAIKDSKWPINLFADTALKLDFDETTSLPSGITFTRATSATYFDSAGTLQTASSGTARFDHRLESGVWVNKGLLIEEQRTNVNQRSEELDNAWYSKFQVTVTANSLTAPDGTTTADTFTPNNGVTDYSLDPQGSGNFSAATQNQNWSGSFFVKNNNLGRFGADLNFRTSVGASSGAAGTNIDFSTSPPTLSNIESGGVILSSNAQDVGNGWWRITFTGYSTNSTTARVSLRIRQASSSVVTGDGSKGVYLWGLQLEQASFASSYIKTTSASVTRNADVASMTSTDFSSWYNATEGTMFWQGDTFVSSQASRSFTFSDGTANERLLLASTVSTGIGFTFSVIDGNVNQANLLTPDPRVAPVAFQTYKHSFAYKVNDFAASLDGSAVGTDTSGTLPTVNRIYLGSNFEGLFDFLNGHIAKFYYWNTRKTNSFLETITG